MRRAEKISDNRTVILKDEDFFDLIDRKLRLPGYARLVTIYGS